MERRAFLKTGSTVATTGIIGLAGCAGEGNGGGEDTPEETPTATPEATPEGTTTETTTGTTGDGENATTVAMVTEGDEYYFDPIGLFVESGETVTFEIESGSHSSTAYEEGNGPAEVTRIPQDAEAWDSGVLSEEGATFEHTFEVAGTYDYFCIPHKTLGMVGRIVVDEPGGPAEGSMPPDGDVPDSQTIVDQGAVPYSEFSG